MDGGPTTIASRTLTRLFDLKTFLRLNVSTLMLVLTVFIMLCNVVFEVCLFISILSATRARRLILLPLVAFLQNSLTHL